MANNVTYPHCMSITMVSTLSSPILRVWSWLMNYLAHCMSITMANTLLIPIY